MIIGMFGVPRCGKTTYLAYCAERAARKKALACGRGAWRVRLGDFAPYDKIYSNFPLHLRAGAPVYKLDFDMLGKFQIENSLILIDEISLVCDSRDFKNYARHTKEFFALHGHYQNDVIYCSQGYEDTDKRIRNMTEIMLYCDRAGAFTRVRPIHKTWSIDGSIVEGYTLAPPLSSKWLYRKPYYQCFDSYDAPTLAPPPLDTWD